MIWKKSKKSESGFVIPWNCFKLLLSFTVEFDVSKTCAEYWFIIKPESDRKCRGTARIH